MELFPYRLQVRSTSDHDMTTIFMRSNERIDPRSDYKLADLYEMVDKSVTVTLDGRLGAIVALEGAGPAEVTFVWRREDFDETAILSVIDGWFKLSSAMMTTRTEATS